VVLYNELAKIKKFTFVVIHCAEENQNHVYFLLYSC